MIIVLVMMPVVLAAAAVAVGLLLLVVVGSAGDDACAGGDSGDGVHDGNAHGEDATWMMTTRKPSEQCSMAVARAAFCARRFWIKLLLTALGM